MLNSWIFLYALWCFSHVSVCSVLSCYLLDFSSSPFHAMLSWVLLVSATEHMVNKGRCPNSTFMVQWLYHNPTSVYWSLQATEPPRYLLKPVDRSHAMFKATGCIKPLSLVCTISLYCTIIIACIIPYMSCNCFLRDRVLFNYIVQLQ